jgi:hypothetical protein
MATYRVMWRSLPKEEGCFTLDLPITAKPLRLESHDGDLRIVWLESNESEQRTAVHFCFASTAAPLTANDVGRYLGSAWLGEQYLHLFLRENHNSP